MTAFACAISVGLEYPQTLAVLIFCAASIAASRVVLGLHYVSDVVAGWILGSLIGLGANAWLSMGG